MAVSVKTYVVGVVFAAYFFLFSVAAAFGDSYSVSVIQYSQSEGFYGIDSTGNFVVNVSDKMQYPNGSCGGTAKVSNCFATYYVGQAGPVFSTTAPELNYDGGSVCSQAVGGGSISGICNNGHELLGGYIGDRRGVWSGTDPLADFLSNGTFDGGFINSLGDAVFIDGLHDALVSVVDMPNIDDLKFSDNRGLVVRPSPAPVPEPASLVLFGSGLLAAMGLVRRRVVC